MEVGEPPSTPTPESQDWVYHVAAQLASADIHGAGFGGPEPGGRRRRALLLGLGALVVVGGGIGIAVASRDGGSSTNAATPTTGPVATLPQVGASTVASGDATTVGAGATSSAAASTPATTGPSTTAPAEVATTAAAAPTTQVVTPTSAPVLAPTTVAAPAAVPTSAAAPAGAPVRWAEYSNGIVTLQGRVPDQATGDDIAGKAAAVVGAGNVRVNYTIDPTAPRPPSAPLYVNDSILFAPGAADLNATARSTLDLGVTLLQLNPQVTWIVVGYTDSTGTEAENLALSQRRVDAIVAYLTKRGIDPARLTAIAKGEADPIADNATPEGRARNRRIEVQVNNLLG